MPSSRPAASLHALLRQRRWVQQASSSSPPAGGASAAGGEGKQEATPRAVPKSFASLQRAGNAVAAAAAAADAARGAAADGSTAVAALDVSASSAAATGDSETLTTLKGVDAFETEGASVLIDEIRQAAYPWNKLRHPSRRQEGVTNSVRDILQALHGGEEGLRVFEQELRPRMRALRRSALYGLAGIGTDAAGDAERARHTARAGEAEESGGPPSPASERGEAEAASPPPPAAAALTTDDLLYLLSLPEHEARVAWRRAFSVGPESPPPPVDAVRRAAVRRVAAEHLREGGEGERKKSVFVPMQEIPLSVMYAELKDSLVPDEYAGMAEQYMATIAESGEEGDVQPAFIPLPGGGSGGGGGGGDDAPPFLPIYLDPYVAEAYTRHLTEAAAAAAAGGGRRYFVAEMKLAELFGELDNAEEEEATATEAGLAPPSVVVGLNHNALSMAERGLVREGGGGHRASDAGEGCFAGRTGALWLTKADRALLKRHTDAPEERWCTEEAEEAFLVGAPAGAEEVAAAAGGGGEGGGETGAGVEEEVVEDAAMCAAQAELQGLLDDMIGLFKCVRRTVRFAYIAVEEVAGEELFRIGLERRCAHNDPLAKRGEAMGGEGPAQNEGGKKKKKRRLRPIITPRGLLRLRMDFARKTAAQKPIPDLLTTEEKPKPYLKKYVLRWVTKSGRVRSTRMEMAYRRRPKSAAKDKDDLWRERIYTHGELVKALKERPHVSELVRKSFVAFVDVDAAEREASAAHPFHASLPFFDCQEEYPAVARALPTEEEFRGHMLERNYAEDEWKSMQHAGRSKSTLMAIRRGESPYSDEELGEVTPEEDYRLTEHDRAEILLGARSSRNRLSLADRHFALARRQHQTLTEGYHKAVATHGPVGYIYHPTKFAEDLRTRDSYLYRRTENADEGMVDHRAHYSADDPAESLPRHMKERAVQKKAKELGVELLRHG